MISSPTGLVKGPLRVEVVFSQPMVSKEQIGPTDDPPLKISPAVKGEARWTDDRTLVFVATETLPGATEFTASVPQGVVALDGHQLKEDHKFAFSTARLTASIELQGSKKLASKTPKLVVRFNNRVAFEQIEKNCRFVSYAGKTETRGVKSIDNELGPSKTLTVTPNAALSAESNWAFECAAALRGNEGSLGLAKAIKADFRTHGKLAFTKADPTGDDVEPEHGQNIELAFTTPLKEPYEMTIEPAVRGFPERCYSLGDSPPGISCSLNLEPQTRYTININGKQTDVFGQTLGEARVVNFKTTDAKPGVELESGYFVAELRRPVVPVWARNASTLDVRAVKVTPESFASVRSHINWWEQEAADFEGEKRIKPVSTKLNISGVKNKWAQVAIDPAKLFRDKPGPGMYYVEIGTPDVDSYPFDNGKDNDGKKKVLVNFTDIGVVSKISPTRGVVWATRLSTGKPLAGAKVEVHAANGKVTWRGRTGSDGIATLPGIKKLLPSASNVEGAENDWAEQSSALNVFVRRGDDFTMVNARSAGGLSAWNFNVSSDTSRAEKRLRGFMHTDRGLYRPGETVHVKGIARESQLGSQLAVPRQKTVEVEVSGPRGKTFHSVEPKVSRFGGFWFDLDLPGDARLGDYTIRASLESGSFSRRFAVEEFRPSTFEVLGKTSVPRIVHRGRVEATIEAKYFYGAPLRGGSAEIAVYQRPRNVSFPEHKDFYFGDERTDDRYYDSSDYSQELVTEDSVTLDGKGRASVSFDVGPADMTKDADLLVSASVSSPSNEVISKNFTIPYFRSKRYFGIKSPGYFLETGKSHTFQLMNVAPDGKAVSGSANVTVERRDWNCVYEDWGYRGSYRCNDIKKQIVKRRVQFTAGKPTPLTFKAEGGGEYWVVVEDGKGKHAAATQLYAWGSDGGSWRSDDAATFEIVKDKTEYRAGDTASLILKTDLAKATGLVTIERDGVIERRFVNITSKNKRITIPIKAKHAPNVYVSVALVQGRMGKGRRGLPRMKMGMVNLPVRPEDNTLTVSVETDEADYRPGGEVTAKVKVTDARGRPVSAEVALTAADEGVLSLIAYRTPNPVPTFYAPWGLGVTTASQYAFIREIPGPDISRPATGGDSGSPGSVRSRFMSTAVWKPGIVTNSAGVALATFKAPDNLTAFRVMAVAADRTYRFGSGEKRFTVSKPVQLHRYLPRFLTVGDKLSGGVVVHNETKRAGKATVTLRTNKASGLVVTSGYKQTVDIKAGGRVPVMFEFSAADAGKSELEFSVELGGEKDAVRFELPIHHPSGVRKTLVKSGITKGDASIAIDMPANAIASTAMVHVSVDPDGLAGIEDGLRDLIGYPYGCLEQTTSKVVPMIAVRGLVESLNLDGLSRGDINKYVTAGIAKIGRHQTSSGGFSLWQGGEAERYYTAYALWGLSLAKKGGYAVDQTRIDDGLRFLARKEPVKSDPYHNAHGDLASEAFGLFIRASLGDKDTAAATRLYAKKDSLPIYGKAFLARALAAGLGNGDRAVKDLVSDLSAHADDANKDGTLIGEPRQRELYYYMSGAMRTTSIVLETLVELDPKNAAIPGLVKTIMKRRRNSPYHTTQGNLYGLLALNAYAASSSRAAPTIAIDLGKKTLLRGTLGGKARLSLASAALPSGGETLTIKPSGEVHYNVEIHYQEKTSELKAASNGLRVKREYLDDKGAPIKSFKVGDVVNVRLTMSGTRAAAHLMLSDRLPAGFEALNTRFATTSAVKTKKPRRSYYGGTREIRDERVDFATEYNYYDEYVREYQMRAIAIGTFAVPPTVAELMYEPEKNARTSLGSIVVSGK